MAYLKYHYVSNRLGATCGLGDSGTAAVIAAAPTDAEKVEGEPVREGAYHGAFGVREPAD